MGLHRFIVEALPPTGRLWVAGEEARHAIRVKRLEVGDAVELLDGKGGVGAGRLAEIVKKGGEWEAGVDVGSVAHRPKPSPRVEVWTGVPEGDRLEAMLDGLSQGGADAWRPLATEFGAAAAQSARARRTDRLARIVVESAKQCGRAWFMEVGDPSALDAGLSAEGVVVADASGGAYAARGGDVRILVGPEGGWSKREVDRIHSAGAMVASFGPHVFRVEVAAVAALAVVRDAEHRLSLRR